MLAPTLTTARLELRAHRVDDLADCLAMWSDPEVVRHISGRLSTREEVWARLLRYAGHWELLGYGFWLIAERDTGRFVGEAGLAEFHRDMDEPFDAPEAGWSLAPHAHGKGYATEAMQAILAWTTHPRTVCGIATENQASLRVAAKLGYREFRRVEYKGQPGIALEWHAPH